LIILRYNSAARPSKIPMTQQQGITPMNDAANIESTMPVPIDSLVSPKTLSGESGSNRAPNNALKQIAANNDLEAIQTWLLEFTDSPQTQRTYRKEAERLLLWAIFEKQKPLSSLTRDDLRNYQEFLIDPQPHDRWCGERKPRSHPLWRPFEGPLSEESVAHAITIISALFNYLVEAGYLAGNPLGLMRRKFARNHMKKNKIMERFLEQDLWKIVLDYIESLPQTNARQIKNYERIRYLFHLLYLLGPRVSEIANQGMSSIKQIRGNWWWEVTGKGQQTHTIPVNKELLNALIRYRQLYDLPNLPQSDEPHALFMNLNGTKSVSSNMIYRLVKKIFGNCAKTLEKTRPDFAEKLKKASTHWMRHTAITHQADSGIELRYIKRNARHKSVETTMLYQHAEEEKWHDVMSQHQMIKK
jgi:site-specific recombinase XerD